MFTFWYVLDIPDHGLKIGTVTQYRHVNHFSMTELKDVKIGTVLH